MKTDEEIMDIINEELEDACNNLWDKLTPEERGRAFRSNEGRMLIQEWLDVTF